MATAATRRAASPGLVRRTTTKSRAQAAGTGASNANMRPVSESTVDAMAAPIKNAAATAARSATSLCDGQGIALETLHYHRVGRTLVAQWALAAIVTPAFAVAQPPLPEVTAGQALTITAPAAPGGGWDQTARAMQRVFADIEPGVNVQVDNVPGAAGTIGLARFIQSERGNPHALLITGLVMMSGVIINGSPVSMSDTTPIARLIAEYEVIAVPASSPHRTLGDLIDAFTRDPGSVSWGGGSAGGTDDLLVRLMAEQIGLPASRVNYIAFSGGGAALAAVLGGQLTAAVSGYAEFAGQIAAGQLRVLAISSSSRVNGIDAPTLRESGVALDLANWRAVVAPPGLSDAEGEALTARITRLATSGQWRTLLAQNGWGDQFLTGPELRQFLSAEQARIEEVFRRLSSTDRAEPGAKSITPMTLPTAAATVLLVAIGLAAVRTIRERSSESSAPSVALERSAPFAAVAAIAIALGILPLIFFTFGFVVSSTVVFVSVASVMHGSRPTLRRLIADVVVGAGFAFVLYQVFTRGLGVALPGLSF